MIGDVIGNYRILKKLGEGGMGIVYLARDMTLEREVALKIISTELARNPGLMARFRVEAIAQAKLNHHNITSIHSFDQEKNNYYIVMEYVNGKTLKAIIKEKEQIPLPEALNIFSQILTGIAYAHSQGVVHRDIKPSNIFLDEHHTVKIGDFGIAKVKGIEGLTKMGATVGSPLYSSPEQLMGKKIDARTDVYSLGITLYEMLTGQLPFKPTDDSDYKIIKEAIEAKPRKPSELDSSIPAAVDEIIMKSLAKSPGDRFQGVKEFEQAVAQLTAQIPVYGPRPAYGARLKKEPAPKQPPKKEEKIIQPAAVKVRDKVPLDPARRKQVLAFVLVLSLVLVAVILYLLFSTGSDQVPQTVTSTAPPQEITQNSGASNPPREFPTTVTPPTSSGSETPGSVELPVTSPPSSSTSTVKPSSASVTVSPAAVPGQMDALIKKDQYSQAVALGLKAIKQGPVIAEIYLKLAQAYFYDGEKKQARVYYWKTLELTDAIRFDVYYQFEKDKRTKGTLAISKSAVSFQPHRSGLSRLGFSISLSQIKRVSTAFFSDIKGIFKKKKNRKSPMLIITGKQKQRYAVRMRTQESKERGFIKDIIDTLREGK